MSRLKPPHEFVDTDPELIEASLTSLYEIITGYTVMPSSPRPFVHQLDDGRTGADPGYDKPRGQSEHPQSGGW